MKQSTISLIIALAISLGTVNLAQAAPKPIPPLIAAENAIQAAYYQRVDRSLKLSGITIVHNWAIARWQGQHDGGMIVFRQVDQQWSIVRGTGGAFTYQDLAFRLGIPEAIAKELIKQGAPELIDTLPIEAKHRH